jgi:hypothetical protein
MTIPPDPIPTFDEWVRYCFTQGRADFKANDSPIAEERRERYLSIPAPVVAEYTLRLFTKPDRIATDFSDDQIAEGVWFIFCEYPSTWFAADLPADTQVCVMRAIASLYEQCFDRVCNARGVKPDDDLDSELDIAVFMIWDMDGIECPAINPERHPHLVEPSFEVLEVALFRCRTATCKRSALHALGHLVNVHPKRVHAMIDRYFVLPKQPRHLREYAKEVRAGEIL